ncbi:MAG TPA: preprotein translocase subunit SecE [Acidimicrobiales bacterium]|nr:preprotein translocase subunit SecE [Acidimicrobiales bacterium]
MNRETKRMMARQGSAGPDGAPAPAARERKAPVRPAKAQRTSPALFLREVRGELRRVAWPTRAEVVNYSTIVLFTLAILIALIFVLDYAFAKSVLFLFETPK